MRPKYRNNKVTSGGQSYDSEIELARHLFLKNREKEGIITNLRRQVPYELIPTQYGEKIKHLKTKDKVVRYVKEQSCSYVADFVYERDGKEVVEDVKGARCLMTADFKIKKKLMLWVKGIEVQIVTNPTFFAEK